MHGTEDPAEVEAGQDGAPHADEFAPVLPGDAPSDYERYLRTDELLALQKPPEERAHHDELLFQVTHQSSELWLKLAGESIEVATEHVQAGEVDPAVRLVGRAVLALRLITDQLEMLDRMSPWEYTAQIRPVLGHGSGFDAPGWRQVRRAAAGLGRAFDALRAERGLSIIELYERGREVTDLYALAEALTDLDGAASHWRVRHFLTVERSIGGEVVGTQGTPVAMLGKLLERKFYPELWRARTDLTELAKARAEGAAAAPPS